MKPFARPVNPWHINQKFGENMTYVKNGVYITVLPGQKVPAGFKSIYGKEGHTGIDLRIKTWQPIYSAADGVVTFVETHPEKGLGIYIEHLIDGVAYRTRYWHLIALNVTVGEKVSTGSFIGYGDNTGMSSGDHLHWATEQKVGKKFVFIDPEQFVSEDFALKINLLTQVREKCAQLLDALSDKARKQ